MIRRALVAFFVVAAGSGCLPFMTPPLKGDVGYAARLGGDHGYRFSVGTHVASLVPSKDFPLDVGGGYVQTSKDYGLGRLPVHGLYLEGGPRIAGGRFWRAFAGPRAEYYFRPGADFAASGMLRASIELFNGTEGDPLESTSSGPSYYWGVAFGTFALGAYFEGGYQKLPSDAGYPLLGAGLLLRIPATAGVLCCAWDFSRSRSRSRSR
ncbi:MAG: hypothetical protein KIT84_25300 [Labilithrix sp.]|nr:hypothetical protein [Labilithrix sp.]MCW5814368.1 hypothetical protein [Labilithrix sp.]